MEEALTLCYMFLGQWSQLCLAYNMCHCVPSDRSLFLKTGCDIYLLREGPETLHTLAVGCSYCIGMEVVLATIYLLPFKNNVSVLLHTGSRKEEAFVQLERNRNFWPGPLSSKSLISQMTDESSSTKKFLLKR